MNNMKKIAAAFLALALLSTNLYALEGEMGYFGGISTGQKLPTTTEAMQDKQRKVSRYTLPYKENIYLTGKAVEVSGTIEVRPGTPDLEKGVGSYSESYVIKAQSPDGKDKVTRSITLDTKYIYDAGLRQMTKTSEIKKWTETVVAEGQTYSLDQKQSSFSKSMLEDYTPGVMYYRGDVQYEAVYRDVSNGNGTSYVTVGVNGPVYGYDNAFAKTETQKRSINIDKGNTQYYIEETPTFTVHKDLQYGANEPGAISFAGNYKEMIRSEGNHTYNILVGDPKLYEKEKRGSMNVTNSSSIEQLPIPDLSKMAGHPARTNVEKMYSLKIFTKDASQFNPNQVVRRGEYIEMLVRAMQLPLPEEKKKSTYTSNKNQVAEPNVFTDISSSDAIYPYAMAAYNAGLISGGKFDAKAPLKKEDMYVLNVRLIGLERLGLGVGGLYTPFVDDAQISSHAKSAIYAASRLGLIPSSNGYIFPQREVTYAEAAALLGQLIDYLRYDLQKDYNEKMMM